MKFSEELKKKRSQFDILKAKYKKLKEKKKGDIEVLSDGMAMVEIPHNGRVISLSEVIPTPTSLMTKASSN